MNTIEIIVTKEDIQTCEFTNSTQCPIAKALKRVGCENVFAGESFLKFSKDSVSYERIPIHELSSKVKSMMNIPFCKRQIEPETFTHTLKLK